MNDFRKITPEEMPGNVFQRINRQWMLITAGDPASFNTMTASWGGMGILWNKAVAFCFIRPQRYTYEFIEKQQHFTLSFLGNEYRDALNLCGSRSGRDIDKVKAAGLTPVFNENSVYFTQAELVLICKKLYYQDINPNQFIDPSIEQNYPQKDYHRMYVGEIETVLYKG